jgi:hypothetical protein
MNEIKMPQDALYLHVPLCINYNKFYALIVILMICNRLHFIYLTELLKKKL